MLIVEQVLVQMAYVEEALAPQHIYTRVVMTEMCIGITTAVKEKKNMLIVEQVFVKMKDPG